MNTEVTRCIITLTHEGKKKAGWFQINSLKITRPKRWDGKWRVVMFDVAELHRAKREALRGLLKQLELCPIQKSVWAHPYDFKDEIELMKGFFGLTQKEIRYLVVEDMGDDTMLRKEFHLS